MTGSLLHSFLIGPVVLWYEVCDDVCEGGRARNAGAELVLHSYL